MGVELVARGQRCSSCGEGLYAYEEIERQDALIADALIARGIRTGEEFVFVRKSADVAAADVARLFGVRPETVWRWEHDESEIPRTAAYALGQPQADAAELRGVRHGSRSMKHDPCQAAQSPARKPASPPGSTIALTSTRPHPGALSGTRPGRRSAGRCRRTAREQMLEVRAGPADNAGRQEQAVQRDRRSPAVEPRRDPQRPQQLAAVSRQRPVSAVYLAAKELVRSSTNAGSGP